SKYRKIFETESKNYDINDNGNYITNIDTIRDKLVILLGGSGDVDFNGNMGMLRFNTLNYISSYLAKNNITTVRWDSNLQTTSNWLLENLKAMLHRINYLDN